jgi:hypothetical protein
VPASIRPGDVLAGRYRLVDLLDEARGGRFFRAYDSVLTRHVAVHVIRRDDERADLLREAAKRSAPLHDRHILRVLDTDTDGHLCFVVNEWGSGRSLDILLADEGPLTPRRAAWMAGEVAEALAIAHGAGVAHGRLVPENVLVDHHGGIRLIGLAVDAALHGLPPGNPATDVTDLAGILYAALTGRWAGPSHSGVPPAHVENGQVLRPRRVRAGIPRVLDQACDDLLNAEYAVGTHARTDHDLTTALGFAGAMREFVGDPHGMAEAEAARSHAAAAFHPGEPPLEPEELDRDRPGGDRPSVDPVDVVTAPVPVVPRPEGAGSPGEPGNDGTTPGQGAGTSEASADADDATADTRDQPAVDEAEAPRSPGGNDPAAVDVPTQAGMPVFDDERDQVAWISARTEKPSPPPPLEDPPEKPLFAPDPVRVPRAGSTAASRTGREEYSPWGDSTGPGTGTGTGTGAVPPYVEDEVPDDGVPGRNWLRLAMVIAAAVLLLLAVVFALGLGRGGDPLPPGESPSAGGSASDGANGEPQPIEGLTAFDIDPQADPPEENPGLVSRAVDGDPGTAWRTNAYNQNFGPAGLKTGLGLVVDLGEVRAPRELDVTFGGNGPTGFTVFLATDRPSRVAGLEPLARESGEGTVTVALDGEQRGRYLVVWLTSLPPTGDGRFRAEIADVVVRE